MEYESSTMSSNTIIKDSVNLNPRQTSPFPKLYNTDQSNLKIPDSEYEIKISDPDNKLNFASFINHSDIDVVPEDPNIMLINAELRRVNKQNNKQNSNIKNMVAQSNEQQNRRCSPKQKVSRKTFSMTQTKTESLAGGFFRFSLSYGSKNNFVQRDYIIKETKLCVQMINETGRKKIDAIKNNGDLEALSELCEAGFFKRVG